jgi:hypothetical protein
VGGLRWITSMVNIRGNTKNNDRYGLNLVIVANPLLETKIG